MWITIGVIIGGLVLTFGGRLLAELPAGDHFIYPIQRLAYAVGEFAFIPTAAVLILGMIILWPLLIQWGIAQGDAVPDMEPPNVALLVLLVVISAVAFGLFQRVDPPRRLESARAGEYVYVFSAREFQLQDTEFFLYECDPQEFLCRSLLEPGTTNRAWNTNMRLQITEGTVRLLNGPTAMFTYPLPDG